MLAKQRNNKLSALAYRVSTILMHSGAREAEFTGLNQMGLCMSHKETIVKQREMGNHHDDKVQEWKADIILRKTAVSSMDEIANQQQGDYRHMTADLAKGCNNYSDQAFQLVSKVVERNPQRQFTKESYAEAKAEVANGYHYR